MHTPPSASSPSPDDDTASYEDAKEAVSAVITWYGRQLLDARRSGDQQRLEELTEQMKVCTEDRRRLVGAAPQEIERLKVLYTERLRNLGAGES
ncbi:hypothetical protein OG500_37675 [Kitasatospora sp. NBC_01250]|uniref:hypothetical protein n=1 Tax=Kitasatospora sp. NBC_01250 TaxID=2903571 RepID=UPI002E3655E1|nr:hypothetical protein [Kitasatospora sp. NBC_01250]